MSKKKNETQPEIVWVNASQLFVDIDSTGQYRSNFGRLVPETIESLAGTLIPSLLQSGWLFQQGPLNVVADTPTDTRKTEFFRDCQVEYYVQRIPETVTAETPLDKDGKPLPETVKATVSVSAAKVAEVCGKCSPRYRVLDKQRRALSLLYVLALTGKDTLVPVLVADSEGDTLERVRQNAETGKREYTKQERAFHVCELFRKNRTANMGDVADLFRWGMKLSAKGKLINEHQGERQHLRDIGTLSVRYPELRLAERFAADPTSPDYLNAAKLDRDSLPYLLSNKENKDAEGNAFVEQTLTPLAGRAYAKDTPYPLEVIEKVLNKFQTNSTEKATTIPPAKWREYKKLYAVRCPQLAAIAQAHLEGSTVGLELAFDTLEKAVKNT